MFSKAQLAEMRNELAVNGYQSLIRLILLHDKKLKTETAARRALMNYCDCAYSKSLEWINTGIQPFFVERVLEFMACYPCAVSRHQLAPRDREAEIWLRHARGIREGMGYAA